MNPLVEVPVSVLAGMVMLILAPTFLLIWVVALLFRFREPLPAEEPCPLYPPRKRVHLQAATVRPGQVALDASAPREVYEPGHPLADGRGMVTFSNVDPLIELADAREAQRSYQANLNIFDQARRMSGSILDLLRR